MNIVLMLVTFAVNYIILSICMTFPVTLLYFFGPGGEALANQILDSGFAFYSALILIPALLSIIPAFQRIMMFFSPFKPAQGEDLEKIQAALAPVLQRGGLDSSQFNLYMNPDSSLNAFAFGNNNIVVNESLLKSFPQEELTGILAHEMGHLQKGHTKSSLAIWGMSMSNQLFYKCYSIFVRIVNVIMKLIPSWDSVRFFSFLIAFILSFFSLILRAANLLLNFPLTLFNRFCSRQDEYEADHYACELGLGRNLYNGLYRLDSDTQQQKLGFFDRILSTHPDMPERLKRIHSSVLEDTQSGQELAEPAQTETKEPDTATISETPVVAAQEKFPVKCPNCGEELTIPDGIYCGNCGADLRKWAKCPACGAYIDKGMQYCTECGQKLAEPGDEKAKKAETTMLSKKLGIAALVVACLALFFVVWNRRTPAKPVNPGKPAQQAETSAKVPQKQETQKQDTKKQETQKQKAKKEYERDEDGFHHMDSDPVFMNIPGETGSGIATYVDLSSITVKETPEYKQSTYILKCYVRDYPGFDRHVEYKLGSDILMKNGDIYSARKPLNSEEELQFELSLPHTKKDDRIAKTRATVYKIFKEAGKWKKK